MTHNKDAPPSAPVGVDGLAGLLEQIRDLLASLPVDCLGTDTSADGQPYPIRDEVIHSITKALTQQPAQAAPGWKLVPVKATDAMNLAAWKLWGTQGDAQHQVWDAMLAAAPTPPGDDAAGGGS